MPNLYPVFEMPSLAESEPAAPKYGEGIMFDFLAGEFVFDGRGNLSATDGHTAWAHWCIKAILTTRYAHLAYSHNYGSETNLISRQPSRRAAEAEIERVVTEALLADERTQTVKDFSFAWTGSQVSVACTVTPTIGQDAEIEVKLYV